MQSGALLLNYYRRLQRGEEPSAAFRAEFGDPTQLDSKFAAYIKAKALPGAVAEIPPPDPSTFSTRVLEPAEVLDEEGIIRVSTRDLPRGRDAFERALKIHPTDAIAHEELGILEYGRGHLALARQQWQAAVATDTGRYVSRFALSMTGIPLRQQTPDQRKETLLELQQIVKLNQQFTPAYVRIAVLQWWQGALDAAIRACAEAERLTPARSDYHLLHAELLMAQNQPQAAAALLRRKTDAVLAEKQADTDYSYTAARLWDSIPAADRGSFAPLAPHPPTGVRTVEGRILNIECGDSMGRSPFRVSLQAMNNGSAEKLMLTSGNQTHVSFFDTVWIGGGHDPVCFVANGQPMYALYKPGSKGYGELLQMELLDDVPTSPEP